MSELNLSHDQEEIFVLENILGAPPGWLLHWGLSSALVFLAVCLTISFFIKYPDKLTMQAEINSKRPPIEVLSRLNEEIDSLYFQDRNTVKKDQVLLRFKSTVNHNDLTQLESFFEKFESISNPEEYLQLKFPSKLELGPMSDQYSEIMRETAAFQDFLKQRTVLLKSASLRREISQLQRLNLSLQVQEGYFQKDLAIVKNESERSRVLLNQGLVANSDQEKSELQLLEKQRTLEGFKSNMIHNEIKIQQLSTEIQDLNGSRETQIANYIFKIRQLIAQLKGSIQNWKELYYLKAPFDGQLSFAQPWNCNQVIKSGEVVCSVIPSDQSPEFIAVGHLPIRSSGTLKIGQKASIDLENYPSNRYGKLEGVVADISAVPFGDTYTVSVQLSKGLTTTYGHDLPKNPQIQGTVTIRTQEYSLLERIFQNILQLTNKVQ